MTETEIRTAMVDELRGFGETGANLAKRQWGFYGFADLVFGALRHYDWTQLEQGQGR